MTPSAPLGGLGALPPGGTPRALGPRLEPRAAGPARADGAFAPEAPGPTDRPAGSKASAEIPFAEVLSDVFAEADALQHRASDAVDDLLSGRSDDVHRVVLDMERANLGLRLAVEVRNRALEAYQEIMRMQL